MATAWPRRAPDFSGPISLLANTARRSRGSGRLIAVNGARRLAGNSMAAGALQPEATVSGQNSPSNSLGLLRDSGDAISTVLRPRKQRSEHIHCFHSGPQLTLNQAFDTTARVVCEMVDLGHDQSRLVLQQPHSLGPSPLPR